MHLLMSPKSCGIRQWKSHVHSEDNHRPDKSKSVSLGGTVTVCATGSSDVAADFRWYIQKSRQDPKPLYWRSTPNSGSQSGFTDIWAGSHYTLTFSCVHFKDFADYYGLADQGGGLFTQWFRAMQHPEVKTACCRCRGWGERLQWGKLVQWTQESSSRNTIDLNKTEKSPSQTVSNVQLYFKFT